MKLYGTTLNKPYLNGIVAPVIDELRKVSLGVDSEHAKTLLRILVDYAEIVFREY